MVGAGEGAGEADIPPFTPSAARVELAFPTTKADRRAIGWDVVVHDRGSRLLMLLVVGGLLVAFEATRHGWAAIGILVTVVLLMLAATVANRLRRRFHAPIPARGSAVVAGGVEVACASCRMWWPTPAIVGWRIVRRALVFQLGDTRWPFDARQLEPGASEVIGDLLHLPPAPHVSSDPPAAEWETSPAHERARMHTAHRAHPAIWFNRVLYAAALFLGVLTTTVILSANERSGTSPTAVADVPRAAAIAALVTAAILTGYSLYVWWAFGQRRRGQVYRIHLSDLALSQFRSMGDVVVVPYDAVDFVEERAGNVALATSDGFVVVVPDAAFRPGMRKILLERLTGREDDGR